MAIRDLGGRVKSEQTKDEVIRLLKSEFANLSEEERKAVMLCLKELNDPAFNELEEKFGSAPTRIYDVLSDAEYIRKPVDIETFVKDPYFLGKTCDVLYPKLLDDIKELFNGSYREAIFSGCIDLDAIIVGGNGSLRTLREWIGNSGNVVSFSEDGPKIRNTGIAKHSGIRDVVRMTLANGMSQRLTPDHRVMVWRGSYQWIPASQLDFGDMVAIASGYKTNPDCNISQNNAERLALSHADALRSSTDSSCLIVPDEICRSSDESVYIYLKSLFSSTGNIIKSKSEIFIRQIQLLLARLGILGKIVNSDVNFTIIISDFISAQSLSLEKQTKDSEISFQPVIELKICDQPIEVGDICDVEDLRSFVSNGIYSHNSIGWGKSFFASICACRILYELSCMRDPHKSFGIGKGTDITMVVLSVKEDLAIKVAFENIANKIKESEYFKEFFPFKPLKKEIIFPNKIQVAARASTDSAALGLNVFAAFIDESNFMQPMRKKGSLESRVGSTDRAQFLYDQLIRRMKSRFQRHGKLPGMMIVVSSKQTRDDFTAKRIRDSKDDPTVFVRDYATWHVKPEGVFSREMFQVLVGNDLIPSKVLSPEEVDPIKSKLQDGMIVIDVPIDFKQDFVNNLEDSIRDIAGVETVSISPFIQQRDKIIPCIDINRQHPFSVEEWIQTDGGKFIWSKLARQVEIRDGAEIQRVWQPLYHSHLPRHIHIDPSLNSDSTGFCVGCVTGYKTVVRRDPETQEQYTERAPEVWIDFILKISPPVGGEIDHGMVRSLVYQLQAKGFSISLVTMDQFNSAPSLQKFASKGISAERLSVDKPMDAYDILKMAIYENRVSFYNYNPLLDELKWIQKDNIRNKVDHPPNKSKDLADALAGVVFSLTTMYHGPPLGVYKGISQYSDPSADRQREIVEDDDVDVFPFLQG